MNIIQKQLKVPFNFNKKNNFLNLSLIFKFKPITRFAIINNSEGNIECEYAEIENFTDLDGIYTPNTYKDIFEFKPRTYVDNTSFNAMMIVPTGVGAETGGDSGDGNVAARLIGNSVDNLFTHPNVVNAADINEMTPNTLYVEGSVLNRFIMGTVGLAPTRGNRILLLYDAPDKEYIGNYTINTASAARVTLGCDIDVLEIKDPPYYSFFFNENGLAVGKAENMEKLIDIIDKYKDDYDSIALHTILDGDSDELYDDYFVKDTLDVNIWGGIEAMITHTISNLLDVTVAHSPQFNDEMLKYEYPIVNPKKCAETLSKTELFCIIKGLYKAPKIVEPIIAPGIFTNKDIHVLITPDKCISIPILAALEQGITVIAVEDNKNIMKNDLSLLPWKPNQFFRAKNYLEASGILIALKNGLSPNSIKRPLNATKIITK